MKCDRYFVADIVFKVENKFNMRINCTDFNWVVTL